MLSVTQQLYKAAQEVNCSSFPGKEEVWSTVIYFIDQILSLHFAFPPRKFYSDENDLLDI